MRIAVFSDSHNHQDNMKKALEMARSHGISQGLHLGDFDSFSALKLLSESGIAWDCVSGNNDDPEWTHTALAGITLPPGDFRELSIGNRTVFITHYPQVARIAALSGKYDAAFHGHNHRASSEMVGSTLLANPGELIGNRFGRASFGIYDTETNALNYVWL